MRHIPEWSSVLFGAKGKREGRWILGTCVLAGLAGISPWAWGQESPLANQSGAVTGFTAQPPPPSPSQDDKKDSSQPEKKPDAKPQDKPETKLKDVEVVEKLNQARSLIVPTLGATSTTLSGDQIMSMPMGLDSPFDKVLLRMPGTAQDGLGQVHVRGEHGNLQYRINDVVLPEGITGFGLELNTRFLNNVQLITGSLPAQYGFRTAGIVDITTRDGVYAPGGEVDIYGGSYETIRPSVAYGGSDAGVTYFGNFTFEHNNIGIENPVKSITPIHDHSNKYQAFVYDSTVLDPTSRLSVFLGESFATFQIPNTPGVAAATQPNGTQWVPGTFDSRGLDDNQVQQNAYVVVAYQKQMGDIDFQLALFGRNSIVDYIPDTTGELFLTSVATHVDKTLYGGGLQGDGRYDLKNGHVLRAGLEVIEEGEQSHSVTTVFPVDPVTGNATGPAFSITDNLRPRATFLGLYAQDEWTLFKPLTINYGLRFDVADFSFDHEHQVSPRANVIYKPIDETTLHAGYARYFTPPEIAVVPVTTIGKFTNTTNQPLVNQDDPVKAERSNYYDAGVSQKIPLGDKAGNLQVGVDGYYKTARNQLDDGLFGPTLILSNFNYRYGRVRGVEFTSSYSVEGFNVYANVAWSHAQGKEWTSAQFLFDPTALAYVQTHFINLDHDQTVTGSFGTSYLWKHTCGSTRVFADLLYGTGLRTDHIDSMGTLIPNGGHVPAYYPVSLGVEETYKLDEKHDLKARLEVVNVGDEVYELRNGTGIGVSAPQFGMRRAVFASVGFTF